MSIEGQSAGQATLFVGPASMAVSKNPDALLCTSSLGACLGIAVYDPVTNVGGLMHCLLPASTLDPKRAAQRPGMFLDTGLTALLGGVRELNANAGNLRIFAAGAAQILDESSIFDIGKIQCEYLAKLLEQLGFELYAQSVGGRTNCSMELTLATGEVRLRYSGQNTAKTLCKR
jgi:chemotaxis protein CheD